MVDVTNQVGRDINLAISHEWLFAPLQFISGLGPRKAAHLQQWLVRSGCTISNRREFVTLHQLGQKVYDNAVSFLRVQLSSRSGKQFRDLLDDTRIHPESYILAEELVNVVYDGNDALECIWYRSGYLERLDIEAYARSKQLEDKMQTLYDKERINTGFSGPDEEPSVNVLFHLLTGLTDDAICEGRIVQATVYSVCPIRASCNTELGLRVRFGKQTFQIMEGVLKN
ncbi:putative RuvA domain 2, transcription elongation factor Spt6, Tex RuvX-like protein [Rosa chinensis]|uniref:Putative RuvA domain 2, transcription elongation factor Spt6, Tex RuvX-like protein n=1 Tax=Rosa chinensis TaxID=74649 RepID=A0A2P6RIP4_ROSCH|nr:putative RuvA domain 2, transcription elongation factor Spt6, Tex RuvX-like protein [Rosa chinensis]